MRWQRGREECLAMHFPQSGLTHLLFGVALASSCIEHCALFEFFARILHAIACDNLMDSM
jgi:hypothetical protein